MSLSSAAPTPSSVAVETRSARVYGDDALVARAKKGDAAALDELYLRHCDNLVGYLRSRVGCPDLAEDLAGDTFVRAFTNLGRYDRGNFAAWLFRIGRNLAVDHHRRSSTKREVPVDEMWSNEASDPSPDPETLVVDRLEAAGLYQVVRRALDQIPPGQRACLVLRFYENRSVAEVAELMERSPGAVRVLQNRAVRSLGELVRAEWE